MSFQPSFLRLGSLRGLDRGWLSIICPTILEARDKKDEAAPDEELGGTRGSGCPYSLPDRVVDGGDITPGGGGWFIAPHGSESDEELEVDIGSLKLS